MTHWVVEETDFQNDFSVAQRLPYVLMELEVPFSTFRYIPFGGTNYDFLPSSGPTVFYGTWNALHDIRSRGVKTPEPFAWYDDVSYRCQTYYDKLSGHVLQDDAVFLTLGEFDESVFGDRNAVFVRPDDNEKSFVGQVVKRELTRAFLGSLSVREWCRESLKIVVSSTKRIEEEWRLVVVGGEPVAGSRYMVRGNIEIDGGFPTDVGVFARGVASRWSPHDVFVMDVGSVSGGYKVVEIGPFNYAGLYKSDLRAVVEAINDHTA